MTAMDTRDGAVLALTGPTACGKSGLAVAIAEQLNGVVINADSMQVYADLALLSARPDAAARRRVPHRLYGVLPAREACSAARWRALAEPVIDAALAAGRLPILVGGTGLYLRALLQGLVEVPPIPDEVRDAVRARQHAWTPAALHAELARRDPDMATKLNVADTQRVARALEVVEATGRSLHAYQSAPNSRPAPYRVHVIAALPPRGPLYRRIETRLDAMVAAGALDEVRALLARNLDPTLPAMKAVGVPQLARAVRGEQALADARADAKTATRRYAKRQLTWLRHQTPRDAASASFVYAQFSESLRALLINEIRESVLTAQP
jgi:tRNA dimethylallyltransferase